MYSIWQDIYFRNTWKKMFEKLIFLLVWQVSPVYPIAHWPSRQVPFILLQLELSEQWQVLRQSKPNVPVGHSEKKQNNKCKFHWNISPT